MADIEARLRSLLTANAAVVSQLELSAVLRRIVESAVELVGAKYGALGVIGPDGMLEEFIHVGLSAETVEAIAAVLDQAAELATVTSTSDAGHCRRQPQWLYSVRLDLAIAN